MKTQEIATDSLIVIEGCSCCGLNKTKTSTSGAKSLLKNQWLLAAGSVLFIFGFFLSNAGSQISFIIATLLAGFPVFRIIFFQVRNKTFFTMEILMTLAIIGAVFIKQFEEAAAIVVLFGIGQILEEFASQRARRGIESLLKHSPRVALLREGEHTREIPAKDICLGQILDVLPGTLVPTDGIIIEGKSSFDESLLTGESIPNSRTIGDLVIGGAIAINGRVQIRATSIYNDNTFSRIIRMVQEAGNSKAPTQRFIEIFAAKYTPIIMIFAICVILAPFVGFSGGFETWFYKGLAVLLIGCPCALVISIPAAVTSAISRASRLGVLIKGGETLELLGKVKTIFFDKTGTITEGKIRVVKIYPFEKGLTENYILSLAGSLETTSSHPIATAIVAKAKELSLQLGIVTEATASAGKGVCGLIGGHLVEILSPTESARRSVISDMHSEIINIEESKGYTVVVVYEQGAIIGIISLSDTVRCDSLATMKALSSEFGIDAVMLTGDNAITANHIADYLGIEVYSQCLPEDKTKLVQEAANMHIVAMVGDGINDAPALASAQVSVAMGTGIDVAIETANIVLARSTLTGFLEAIRLSKATHTIIIQNVVFAIGFKVVFLVLAFSGLASLWMAIVADTGATLLVTANALRLLNYRSSLSLFSTGRRSVE